MVALTCKARIFMATAPLSGISKTMRATPAKMEGPRFCGDTGGLRGQITKVCAQNPTDRWKPIDQKHGVGQEAKDGSLLLKG